MAFLSMLDDRARPKGSRDPLGFELVWTHFGRRVVGNLTTITSSWRIFSVGLLGFYWCNQLCRDLDPREKQQKLQEHFIRYEQLAAYLRVLDKDDGELLGVTRVRKRLLESPRTVSISDDPQHQILSDQINYGIWGLYSTALRESGLIHGDNRELTERGLQIAKQIEEKLDRDWYWRIISGVRKFASMEDLESRARHFKNAIGNKSIKAHLVEALLKGPATHQVQYDLYKSVEKIPSEALLEERITTSKFSALICEHAVDPRLISAIEDIQNIERLLVTANILFDYCRRKDGERLDTIATTVRKTYDFAYLPEGPDLAAVPYASSLSSLREQLRSGEVLSALQTILKLHWTVMNSRGGAAWVEVQGDGKVRVRVPAEKALLPPQDQLQAIWHYDYFLHSYLRIASSLRG